MIDWCLVPTLAVFQLYIMAWFKTKKTQQKNTKKHKKTPTYFHETNVLNKI